MDKAATPRNEPALNSLAHLNDDLRMFACGLLEHARAIGSTSPATAQAAVAADIRRLGAAALDRLADVAIPGGEEVIMALDGRTALIERTFLVRDKACGNLYIHRFRAGDTERALHDHPWASISVILRGSYREQIPGNMACVRKAGDVIARAAGEAHRIDLGDDPDVAPTFTLFATGGKTREWGFHCPGGWKHWQDYHASAAGC